MGIKKKYNEIIELYDDINKFKDNDQCRAKREFLLQKIRIFFELNYKDSTLMAEILNASNRKYWKTQYSGDYQNTQRKNSDIESHKTSTIAKALIEIKERIGYEEDKPKEIVQTSGKKKVSIYNIKKEERISKTAEFINKAKDNIKSGEQYKIEKKWDNVVKESIDAIELLLKSILISSIGKYPTTHDFQDQTSIELFREADKIAEKEVGMLKDLFNFGRPFFLAHFWAVSYTYTKYSGEYGSSTILYQQGEGDIALNHAKEVLTYAENIHKYFLRK